MCGYCYCSTPSLFSYLIHILIYLFTYLFLYFIFYFILLSMILFIFPYIGNRLIPAQLRSLTEDLSIYDLMSYLVEAGSPFVKRLTHEIMVILTENKLEKYIGIHQSEEFYQSDTFKVCYYV